MKLYCKWCKIDAEALITQAGPHRKASCGKCGKYIKFIGAKKEKRHSPGGDQRMLSPGEVGYMSKPIYRRKIYHP